MWVVRIGPGAGLRSAGGSAEVWNSGDAGVVRRLKCEFAATAAATAATSGFGRIRVNNGFRRCLEKANFIYEKKNKLIN